MTQLCQRRKSLNRILLTFISVCLVSQAVLGQRARKAPVQQTGMSADKLLSLGDFYFRNNDISDAADRYYRQAIKAAPRSQAAGYAQFNRANYWWRKYFIVKEQFSKEDKAALSAAEVQYYDFIDKFAQANNVPGVLSDAEFSLALVYLKQGKRSYASGWLNRMLSEAVSKDPQVNVYRVVWSSNVADIVDRTVDARKLAIFTNQLVEKNLDFNTTVNEIRRWCMRQ